MEKYIKEFQQQLLDGVNEVQSIKLTKINVDSIKNVVICGLGGSGIGATIIKNYTAQILPIHLEVVKDYNLPQYIGSDTLTIVCSYSGMTEETFSCLDQALIKNSQIVIVTSGGELMKKAELKGLNVLALPTGYPPRAALAFSLVMILKVLQEVQLVPNNIFDTIKSASAIIQDLHIEIQEKAYALAQNLKGKLPVIYSEASLEGVAIRWRQQINENSKMLCYHHFLPELNHNEIVAMRSAYDNMCYVFLRHNNEIARNIKSFDFIQETLESNSIPFFTVETQQEDLLTNILYLIHFGDWVSYYLAQLKCVDPIEVEIIDQLKLYLKQ